MVKENFPELLRASQGARRAADRLEEDVLDLLRRAWRRYAALQQELARLTGPYGSWDTQFPQDRFDIVQCDGGYQVSGVRDNGECEESCHVNVPRVLVEGTDAEADAFLTGVAAQIEDRKAKYRQKTEEVERAQLAALQSKYPT